MSSSHIKLARFFWLCLLVNIFLCPSLWAEEKEASALEISGKRINKFGSSACRPDAEVKVILPPKITVDTKDFRGTFSNAKKPGEKIKGETVCDATLHDSAKFEKFTVDEPTIQIDKFLPDSACGKGEGRDGTRVLCIYEGDGGKDLVSYAIYSYDTKVLKIDDFKKNLSAVNGEVSFEVSLTGDTKGIKVEVCYVKIGPGKNIDADGCPGEILTFDSTLITVTDLENDVEYGFKIRVQTEPHDPNIPWSKSFTEKPVKAGFPLSSYDGKDAGLIQWSCRQSSSSSLLLLFMTLIALFSLRYRAKIAGFFGKSLLLCLLMGLFSANAQADLGQMNFGLLGSLYRPDLDNQKNAAGNSIFPFYKCYFRNKTSDKEGPINPLMGVEVDWHLWDGFGSLQLGVGLGYTYKTGRALKLNPNGMPDCDSPIENAKASLHMYQFRPQLTYMFNPFAEYFPLIPYLRAAMIGHGYMFFRGDKNEPVATNKGVSIKPNGIQFGYQLAVGMMLMMDFLEPSSIRNARGGGLLEHVYLKAELAYTVINGFGKGFNFSAKDVMGTSLPLLWTFGLVFELPE